ncbi:TPA: hypothetical protein ACH3X1_008193 [Trebouxia sp. C0004]
MAQAKAITRIISDAGKKQTGLSPRTNTSLQEFWGLANYFKKFIMGWAVLVSALQALLKKSDTLSGMQTVTLHLTASSMLFAMLLCWPCQT